MASISMVTPFAAATGTQNRLRLPTSDAFFRPLHLKPSKLVRTDSRAAKLRVEASLKEKVAAGITAAAVAASLVVVPEAALAADSLTPSLQNFLLSIAAGGVVLGVIAGAVVGVSNFDPVKRD